MDWLKKIENLSHAKLQQLAVLCGGIAVLVMVAVVMSSSATFIPSSVRVAVEHNNQQPAAAWWSQFSNYEGGWPLPHALSSGMNPAGYCNAHFYACPLPSYFDVSVPSDPSQTIVASVVHPGYYFGYLPYQGPTYTGPPTITVPGGQSIKVEWACQNWQSYSYTYNGSCNEFDVFDNCIGTYGGGTATGYWYDYAYGVGSGPGFTAGTSLGTVVLTPPPGSSTYSLYCLSAGWSPNPAFGVPPLPSTPLMSIVVNAGAAPTTAAPTLSITGNGKNPVAVSTGDIVDIRAIFTPASGDALLKTAINDFANNLWCGTGCTPNNSMWTTPLTPKEYNLDTTTLTPGSYIFYPAAQTTNYPAWDNYSQSLTVRVCQSTEAPQSDGTCSPTTSCTNGSGPAGACTSCNAGFHLSGGACVADPSCANGSGPAGACTSCDPGFHLSGGSCVADPTSCPGPHEDPNNSCNCINPYQRVAGVCVIKPTISLFSIDQSKVRSGNAATINWTVTGLIPGGDSTCTISSNTNGFSQSMPVPNPGATWSGSHVSTGALTKTTTFTLTCSNGSTQSRTVGIIPGVIEI